MLPAAVNAGSDINVGNVVHARNNYLLYVSFLYVQFGFTSNVKTW